MGAHGMGAVKDSQLGSVTERFVRRVPKDTLVVRNADRLSGSQGAIVVGLDGSPQSFHGLKLGIFLAKALGRPLRAVAVYDPYLHYAMFNGIVGVLNEKASKIFRFKEQEQLHEEIIDTGLAKIYQSHLEIARKLALEDGVDLQITLLDGKCFEKILTSARKEQPLLQILAEDLAVAELRKDTQAATAICSVCGYTVKGPNAVVTCPVCAAPAEKFQTITREVVETIAAQEGGVAEEESMPGVVVKWSADARDALREVTDGYLRRRAKARVEKYARSKKIPVITCQLALPMIEETVGRDKLGAGREGAVGQGCVGVPLPPGERKNGGRERGAAPPPPAATRRRSALAQFLFGHTP